jgi:hypothetical protein
MQLVFRVDNRYDIMAATLTCYLSTMSKYTTEPYGAAWRGTVAGTCYGWLHIARSTPLFVYQRHGVRLCRGGGVRQFLSVTMALPALGDGAHSLGWSCFYSIATPPLQRAFFEQRYACPGSTCTAATSPTRSAEAHAPRPTPRQRDELENSDAPMLSDAR